MSDTSSPSTQVEQPKSENVSQELKTNAEALNSTNNEQKPSEETRKENPKDEPKSKVETEDGRPSPPLPVSVIPTASSNIVKVRGLSYSARIGDMITFFRGYRLSAEPDSVLLCAYKNNSPISSIETRDKPPNGTEEKKEGVKEDFTNEAYVTMEKAADAEKAVERLNRNRMGIFTLELTLSSEEEKKKAKERYEKFCQERDSSIVLRLRGFPYSSTEETVYKFLPTVKGIKEVNLSVDVDGNLTGDAFVTLATPEDVIEAQKYHEKTISDRYIEVLNSSAHERESIMAAASRRPRYRSYNRGRGGMRGGRGRRGMTYDYGYYPSPYQQGYDDFYGHIDYPGDDYYMMQRAMRSGYMPQTRGVYPGWSAADPGAYFGPPVMGPYPTPYQQPPLMGAPPLPPYNYYSDPQMQAPADMYYDQRQYSQRETSPYIIRVRGLPYDADEDQVAYFFAPDVQIVPQGVHLVFNESSEPTGEAYVELENGASVERALAKNGIVFRGCYIEVLVSSVQEMRSGA